MQRGGRCVSNSVVRRGFTEKTCEHHLPRYECLSKLLTLLNAYKIKAVITIIMADKST